MAKSKSLGFRIPKINIIKEIAKRRIIKPTRVIKKTYRRHEEKVRFKKELSEADYDER